MTDKAIMAPSIGDILDLSASWQRELRSANLSPRTVQSYAESVRMLAEYLAAQGMPTQVANVAREHVQSFIEDQLRRYKPATAAVRFASLRVFFNWLLAEGEIRDSPMQRMRKPKQPVLLTDIPRDDDLKRLLASMSGDDFEDLRDTAILRVFLSTGARLAEVAGLRWDPGNDLGNDVDLDARLVRYRGKGGLERVASLNAKAVRALDRYLRRGRKHHAYADATWLWLGKQGRFTASGISQMVRDRAEACGFRLHPHALRHYRADQMMADGMQDGDIMALMGWRSAEMLRRYAASRRKDRAIAAVRRLSARDEL